MHWIFLFPKSCSKRSDWIHWSTRIRTLERNKDSYTTVQKNTRVYSRNIFLYIILFHFWILIKLGWFPNWLIYNRKEINTYENKWQNENDEPNFNSDGVLSVAIPLVPYATANWDQHRRCDEFTSEYLNFVEIARWCCLAETIFTNAVREYFGRC